MTGWQANRSMQVDGFAESLRRNRKWAGLTQDQLGTMCGLPGQQISHFESGRRAPSLKNFCALCNALRVMPEELLR